MDIELSVEQQNVMDLVLDWFKSGYSHTFSFGGFAGTGKTTLLSKLRRELFPSIKISYCCFTAKAATVLKNKLRENHSLYPSDFCGTIHSLIYIPEIDKSTQKIIGWKIRETLDCKLIVIDEASMVSREIYSDLLSYGIPILAVGDCFQLPPIEGSFNLMDKPDLILETIHRQAENNPIIKLSMIIRDQGYIEYGGYGGVVAKVHKNDPLLTQFIRGAEKDMSKSLILCATNKKRVRINERIRELYGFKGDRPLNGERVICLRNNYDTQECPLVNGLLGYVRNIADGKTHWEMEIDIDNEESPYFGPVCKKTFLNAKPKIEYKKFVERLTVDVGEGDLKVAKEPLDYFDFGYCISVHKAQGSQAENVMVVEEHISFWNEEYQARWLYTAITRAQEKLLIVGNR